MTKDNIKTEKKITDRWKKIHSSVRSTSNEIQKALLELIGHYDKHKDIRLINKCVFSEHSGIRTNAVKAYLEEFCSVSWNAKEKVFKHRKTGKINLYGAKQVHWSEFTTEPVYKSVNIMKLVKALIKKAQEDIKLKASTCDKDELKLLEDLGSKFTTLHQSGEGAMPPKVKVSKTTPVNKKTKVAA